jgi:hypothetical protein
MAVGARDSAGISTNFTAPTVAGGKVFVAALGSLSVFGPIPVGTASGQVQADHYLVTGAVQSAASEETVGEIDVNQNIATTYAINAVGPDGFPIKLNTKAHVSYRDFADNSTHYIADVTFANDCVALFTYAFSTTSPFGYELYVTDDSGHTSLQPNWDNPELEAFIQAIQVAPTNKLGVDHLIVTGSPTVRTTKNESVVVEVYSGTGEPLAVTGTLDMYDTIPNIWQLADNNLGVPGFGFENVGIGAVTFGKVLAGVQLPTTTAVGQLKITGLGKHVIIVTGGGITSTLAVVATP